MAEIVAAALTFASLTLLGPGALAPADAGVLEGAQANRLAGCCERNLDRPAEPGVVLVATQACGLVGHRGLLIVPGAGTLPVAVVDCQDREELPRLDEVNILADASVRGLGHERGWLLLWKQP